VGCVYEPAVGLGMWAAVGTSGSRGAAGAGGAASLPPPGPPAELPQHRPAAGARLCCLARLMINERY